MTTIEAHRQGLFLSEEDLRQLTGRKLKGHQIAWLRTQAIPFRVNATGHPVVTRAAVEGRTEPVVEPRNWTPRVVGG